MAGNDPTEAYRSFRDPLNEALGCITAGRLTVPRVSRFETGRVYAVVANLGNPIRLRGEVGLFFSSGHRFRIVRTEDPELGPFDVETVEYWYQFESGRGEELLAFHWTPEARDPGQRTYPHLHVGSVMISARAPLFPDRFSKVHVPTGRVSLEAVVRLAIEELGVRPIRSDWESVVTQTETSPAGRRLREP